LGVSTETIHRWGEAGKIRTEYVPYALWAISNAFLRAQGVRKRVETVRKRM